MPASMDLKPSLLKHLLFVGGIRCGSEYRAQPRTDFPVKLVYGLSLTSLIETHPAFERNFGGGVIQLWSE
jgi:hypothetical protein